MEDEGPVTYWRLPPHQWSANISRHLTDTIHIGGRADHSDFKFPSHIEIFLFQMGVCTQQPLGGMEPTCRMTCQADPGRVTFALFQDPDDTLGLGVTDVAADRNITAALSTAGHLLSPTDYIGKRVTAFAGAPSPTFKQIRRMITSLFPMMTGPLQVDAVGDGTHTDREDLIKIDTRLPLGEGSVRALSHTGHSAGGPSCQHRLDRFKSPPDPDEHEDPQAALLTHGRGVGISGRSSTTRDQNSAP